MKKVINGVSISHNPMPGALFPICTRVKTGDKWSVSECFYNREEAEKYANLAPFADRTEETKAFNAVRAETLANRAARMKAIGQDYAAAKDLLLADLYKKAAETGETVTTSDKAKIDWMNNKTAVEKAAVLEEKQMKKYTVKEEYLDMWGSEMTTETIIDQAEVERLAREWEKPVEELMEQLNALDD